MAAIEGLEELSRPSGEDIELRDQATAASFCAFDIRRLLQVPAEKHDRLSLCAAAFRCRLLRRSLVRPSPLVQGE